MKLIFATHNQHKADEIRAALGNNHFITIVTLNEAGMYDDIPEPYPTLEQNAGNKSKTIYELVKFTPGIAGCFSEDTGLETEALHGEPGVRSARYAGDEKSFEKNIEKLLSMLKGQENRKARFRTVISLTIGENEHLFEGTCEGIIIDGRRGEKGFGYDSVFIPRGAHHTFAEMDMEEKNLYSHRKKATEKLVAFLKHSVQNTDV